MGRPRLILLIRHAQSEGNQNKAIHQTIPDHRVKLTQFGHEQARAAGHRLKDLLVPEDTIQIYTSPYRRTRETTAGLVETLGEEWKSKTTVYEEPRIREQDFGNFQGCSAYQERIWQERAAYGHFFYRIPNGESAADAYDRVSGFNESLWRQFAEPDCPSVIILVTHGLMTRVFLMKWYHYTVEEFEDWMNVEHCKFIIMQRNERGKYDLETKLRKWSDYEKQQKEAAKNNPEVQAQREAKQKKFQSMKRKWGGCPDGCTHGQQLWAQPYQHQHNHPHQGSIAAVIDQNDKDVIEKAIASSHCTTCGHELQRNRSKKSLRPVVRIEPPTMADSSSDDESSRVGSSDSGKLHSGVLNRGRDGGGSKSGFNSDYEAEDEIDSEREKQELSERNSKILQARNEKLGDMKSDSDWSKDSEGKLSPTKKNRSPM